MLKYVLKWFILDEEIDPILLDKQIYYHLQELERIFDSKNIRTTFILEKHEG